MAVVYGRYVRKITKQVQDSLAGATQVAEERISNIRTVRAFSQEGFENKRYQDQIATVLSLARKEAMAQAIFFGMVRPLIMQIIIFYCNLIREVFCCCTGNSMHALTAHILISDRN